MAGRMAIETQERLERRWTPGAHSEDELIDGLLRGGMAGVVSHPMDNVLWKVGLVMGVANLVGGYVGARTAVSRGSRFVRVFFIAIVSCFIVRIGGDVLGLWGAP